MRTAVVCFILALFALAPIAATAQPTISIYTNADTYQSGDTIEVGLSAQNYAEATSLDVYIVLIGPDGVVYAQGPGGWSRAIQPWASDIRVPSMFSLDRTPFWWFDVPCEMPPIGEIGGYSFVAAMAHSGTFDFIGDLSSSPFTVSLCASSQFYCERGDGR